jgi:hypothetical protein
MERRVRHVAARKTMRARISGSKARRQWRMRSELELVVVVVVVALGWLLPGGNAEDDEPARHCGTKISFRRAAATDQPARTARGSATKSCRSTSREANRVGKARRRKKGPRM